MHSLKSQVLEVLLSHIDISDAVAQLYAVIYVLGSIRIFFNDNSLSYVSLAL